MAKKKRGKVSDGAYKDQKENTAKSGSRGRQAVDFSKLDQEPEFFTPSLEWNRINIIPFELKSKLHPSVHRGNCEIGELAYVCEVSIHRGIGPKYDDILCPKKNYGKHCPICDEVSELYKQGKEKEAKQLQASARVFYNVVPVRGEHKGKLMVMESSAYLFEKNLVKMAHACEDGEDIVHFADIDDGTVVKFYADEVEKTINGKKVKYLEFANFTFPERKEELLDEWIDEAISFDELLVLLPASEIEKILFEGDEEEEDEEEEDEAPRQSTKKKRPEPEDEDELEDEDEEDEEDEKAPSKKAPSKGKCPMGHKFGKEADQHKDCSKCPEETWDTCAELSQENV
jgi:hypothetical protein